MSTNVPAARPAAPRVGRWAGLLASLTLGVALCLGGHPGWAAASPQQADRSLREALRQADEHYRAGRLQQAEALYRRALSETEGEVRRHCCERLLAIYTEAGRLDRAVTLGEWYEGWLRATRQ